VLIVIPLASRIDVAGMRWSLGPLVVMALLANIAPLS
jgi:hypothetical protein